MSAERIRAARPGPFIATTFRLAGEEETVALGTALAAVLGPGDAVLLSGPLGAGKSALARAVIRARLGAPEAEVPSPSYTLVNVYDAPGGQVWHADLYRLGEPEETAELGLPDALGTALVLVEWPDRLGSDLPARRLEIALAMPQDETAGTVRDARIRAVGPGWERVAEALARWR